MKLENEDYSEVSYIIFGFCINFLRSQIAPESGLSVISKSLMRRSTKFGFCWILFAQNWGKSS